MGDVASNRDAKLDGMPLTGEKELSLASKHDPSTEGDATASAAEGTEAAPLAMAVSVNSPSVEATRDTLAESSHSGADAAAGTGSQELESQAIVGQPIAERADDTLRPAPAEIDPHLGLAASSPK